ncbi:unnamed protein product [Brassicogethes aeneus]|uniref:BHLH domain-containing protein n=1 Tax=Brassicogethes aeneus TaxID=1431903 RepID=A0A9P0FAH4_BRAAE|nr:unnamed protein product [Brassicogethes aeneus]
MIEIKTEIKAEEIDINDIKSEYMLETPRDMFAPQNTEPPLLSDDIWNKFELDFPELTDMDDIFKELDTGISENSLFNLLNDCEIRNHDCMWAGHCGSKEHPADEPRLLQTIVPIVPPVVHKNLVKPPNPQSLLKPRVNLQNTAAVLPQQQVSLMHTPQTPPMSDDEEGKSKKNDLVKILQDTISEIDLPDVDDEDIEELLDLDDEEDEEEEEEQQKVAKEQKYAASYAANDHSYHKEKNSYVLDTPSDSEEEEIDVVSVEKSFSRMASSLPTNPSTRDRQQLQRRMATAISRKRIPTNSGTIKTLMPLNKKAQASESGSSSSSSTTTAKRRVQENRGVKRTKQYRMPASTSPYKKRQVYGSSDSEPEPSEKRSLHNNMERQRRIDLRNAFEDLRMLVPEVSKKERAAKVVILREAAQYCDGLGRVSQNYSRQCDELKRQQEWLRQRVSQLRRNLAAKR